MPRLKQVAVANGWVSVIVPYKGPESRWFAKGPNWWQVTFPPKPKWGKWRLAIIRVRI